MTRFSPPLAYACLPLSSRKAAAWSVCPFWRAVMNELTTAELRSSVVGTGGSEGADAAQSAPPRKNAKAVPLGAHIGKRYVPLASFVRAEPSGRTWYRTG